jgi:osmotically-inducible protein OsmY
MKQIKFISTSIFVALFAAMLGCASTPEQESTGEYLDDSVITTKVKAAIFNEPSLNSAEINVETFRGAVQLSGFVSTAANIKKAIEITHRVRGVRSVQNHMQVKN